MGGCEPLVKGRGLIYTCGRYGVLVHIEVSLNQRDMHVFFVLTPNESVTAHRSRR